MFDLVIVGAGGFAREVYRWATQGLTANSYRMKGFLSHSPDDLDAHSIDYPILGDPADYRPHPAEHFLFAIGDVAAKKTLVDALQARGARFMTLVHPTAIVAPSARLGEGAIVCPFALISDNVVLEDFVTLNFYASCGHDAVIGKYSILSPYATVNGGSRLEAEVFMGTHSTVTARRLVGRGAKISANSVVMHDVPPRTLVHGVPGRHSSIFAAEPARQT
jgi:sugar O-acyltransferase (sialic acid O-acetyltransferase NeuD family)